MLHRNPHQLFFAVLLWFMAVSCLPHTVSAQISAPGENKEYILILNSFAESTPWSSSIISNILTRIERTDNTEVYIEYMNSLMITSFADIRAIEHNLTLEYKQYPPRLVVMLGSPVVLLRNHILKTWPGVPLILCTEEDYLGPEEYYLKREGIPEDLRMPLSRIAESDNLTLVQAPIFLRENVQLMRRMIPGMEELIFIGDGRYINQQVHYDLKELLRSEFPTLKYRFFSAEEMSIDTLLDTLSDIDTHRTGLLFSTWHYVKHVGNISSVVTDSYKIIASLEVPMFALLPTVMGNSGLIGGYIYLDSEYNELIISVIDKVLSGVQPSEIPFSKPKDTGPIFNYSALVRKGISPNNCPPNTLFINKPVSFFERNKEIISIGISLLVIFIAFQQWRISLMRKLNAVRRRETESQARYFNLFNNMPIIYVQQEVVFDKNGYPEDTVYCDVNTYYEKVFIPRDRVLGKLGSEFFTEKWNLFLACVHTALIQKSAVTFPFYYSPRDAFYDVMICPSYIPGYIDIYCLDRTALHYAQQKLTSINHKLSTALAIADIIPWKWDLTTRTIFWDVNCVETTEGDQGTKPTSERFYFTLIHPEDRQRVLDAYEDLLQGHQQKAHIEYRIRTSRSGVRKIDWVEVQAVIGQRDEQGTPLTIVGSLVVISERKRMEQELRTARDRAEESNRLKSAFLANMSHEIRTPLNAIVGFSSMLSSTTDPQEQEEYVRIIENNNKLLLQLIGDILDLSKIEAGTLEFTPSDFDLNEMMRELEEIIQMRVRQGVGLVCELPSQTPFTIHTDRTRLSQVVTNLLTNAVKFTDKGEIRFGYTLRGRELRFFVCDTGSGIPTDNLSDIFGRFVKLDTFKQGTGLGLSICKTIVEHMGGEIEVESAEGKGSCFRFTIPLTENNKTAHPLDEQ